MMGEGHDVRTHRPGESAECSQCGRTVWDRWTEIPHHGEAAVEVKTWCRGCLLEHVGIDADVVARTRAEDARPDEPAAPAGPVTTCPQRMHQPGPWEQGEGLDHWRLDDEFEGWAPRTCSFCGSVRGADVFRLLGSGWTVEWALGKTGYKAYLHVPEDRRERGGLSMAKVYGWHLTEVQMRELDAAIRRREGPEITG